MLSLIGCRVRSGTFKKKTLQKGWRADAVLQRMLYSIGCCVPSDAEFDRMLNLIGWPIQMRLIRFGRVSTKNERDTREVPQERGGVRKG